MTYQITYSLDKRRIVPAVLIDNRATNGLAGKTGFEIKSVTDAAVLDITTQDIFYLVETELGNLAGYFVLRVYLTNFSVNLISIQLRPAFKDQSADINQKIADFVNSGLWKTDYLI
jgi:hypothetical protein